MRRAAYDSIVQRRFAHIAEDQEIISAAPHEFDDARHGIPSENMRFERDLLGSRKLRSRGDDLLEYACRIGLRLGDLADAVGKRGNCSTQIIARSASSRLASSMAPANALEPPGELS
jgi:hypothetical protein